MQKCDPCVKTFFDTKTLFHGVNLKFSHMWWYFYCNLFVISCKIVISCETILMFPQEFVFNWIGLFPGILKSSYLFWRQVCCCNRPSAKQLHCFLIYFIFMSIANCVCSICPRTSPKFLFMKLFTQSPPQIFSQPWCMTDSAPTPICVNQGHPNPVHHSDPYIMDRCRCTWFGLISLVAWAVTSILP